MKSSMLLPYPLHWQVPAADHWLRLVMSDNCTQLVIWKLAMSFSKGLRQPDSR